MKALAAIRDSGKPSHRLYRDTHDTFEEYCRDRWGFSDSRARQYMLASQRYGVLKTVKNLTVLPATESHVAQLTRCESDDQAAEVWQQVVDDDQAPVSYVISANLHRRQLSATKRAMVGAKLATLKNGEVGNGRKVGPSNEGATSVGNASQLLNVGESSIERAKQVIDSKSKPLIDAVGSPAP